jgi:hypothetical protein
LLAVFVDDAIVHDVSLRQVVDTHLIALADVERPRLLFECPVGVNAKTL